MKRLPLFCAALVLALTPLLFIHPVRVRGDSMAPTLRDGELCFALRSWCAPDPARGQIWVVRSPEGEAVKRLLALPGERLDLQEGAFRRDGRALAEPYVRHEEPGSAGPWEARDGYLLLGDNRPASRDGRSWGPLPRRALTGYIIHK